MMTLTSAADDAATFLPSRDDLSGPFTLEALPDGHSEFRPVSFFDEARDAVSAVSRLMGSHYDSSPEYRLEARVIDCAGAIVPGSLIIFEPKGVN